MFIARLHATQILAQVAWYGKCNIADFGSIILIMRIADLKEWVLPGRLAFVGTEAPQPRQALRDADRLGTIQ